MCARILTGQQVMSREVHQPTVRGGRPQQGRECLYRPLRVEVLRGEQEGRGEDAERRRGSRRRCPRRVLAMKTGIHQDLPGA